MKIIFCIAGQNFSNQFLRSWTDLTLALEKTSLDWELVIHYHPEVHQVRNILLGGNKELPVNQKPWDSQKKYYDYITWIDSDIVFKPEQFFKLLKHDKDIVSGLYYRSSGNTIHDIPSQFSCVAWSDDKINTKSLFTSDIIDKTELIEVKGNGMGFMLVKRGVFESIEYPWFEPKKIYYEIKGKRFSTFFQKTLIFK